MRSAFSASESVLIKVLGLLSAHGLIVIVSGNVFALSGAKELRLDIGDGELFKRHAVVVKKAGDGHGRGEQDADPACGLLSGKAGHDEVGCDGDPHGQNGADELPPGQAEKDAFLVLAYLFRDFDFDYIDHLCGIELCAKI